MLEANRDQRGKNYERTPNCFRNPACGPGQTGVANWKGGRHVPLSRTSDGQHGLRLVPAVKNSLARLSLRSITPTGGVSMLNVFYMLQNHVDAEDVSQEVFLQLLRKAHTFRGESSFSTWLHRLTTNCVLMELRRKRRRAGSECPRDCDWHGENSIGDDPLDSYPAPLRLHFRTSHPSHRNVAIAHRIPEDF